MTQTRAAWGKDSFAHITTERPTLRSAVVPPSIPANALTLDGTADTVVTLDGTLATTLIAGA